MANQINIENTLATISVCYLLPFSSPFVISNLREKYGTPPVSKWVIYLTISYIKKNTNERETNNFIKLIVSSTSAFNIMINASEKYWLESDENNIN